MSVELQVAFPCQHLVIEEPVPLQGDRLSLVPKAPVANANVVRVLADDRYYIPATGLYSQAVLVGGTSGPFVVRRCTNLVGPDGNLLVLTTSAGTVEVRLPVGERVTASAVEQAIRTAAFDFVQVGTRNGAIVLADTNAVGVDSFVRVSGQGAAVLGFTAQTGARGTQVYPPWQLASRPDTYPSITGVKAPVPARYPKFVRPVKSNPTFKVTYAAPPEQCPRCRATYVENDMRFDPQGELVLIDNENLLYQACMKALLTRKGSNDYHPAYGSTIMDRVGTKFLGATTMLLQEDVRAALLRVQKVQNEQAKYQAVTSKERFYALKNVQVTPGDDPTTALVQVTVTNASLQPINLSIVFSVPGAVALAGTNGQTLGLQGVGL